MAEARRPWLGQALNIQSGVSTILIASFSLAALMGVDFGLGLQVCILLAGLVLIGIPHGAFDHFVARAVLEHRLGRAWSVVFVAAYLSLAGLVWLAWVWVPQATLAVFLAGTVLHFGLGDTEDGLAPLGVPRGIVVLAYGLLPVLLPIAFHSREAAMVLAAMARMSPDDIELWLRATKWLVPCWILAFGWIAGVQWREGGAVAERFATMAAFVLLPPLIAFALYFAIGHSARHVLRLAAWHSPYRQAAAFRWVARVLIPAGIASAVGIAGFALVDPNVITGLLAPSFQVIAALTLPHMIVTSWLDPKARTT